MPFYDTVGYCNAGNQTNTGYYAVPLRPQNTAVVAGQLVRQFTTPTVGNERVWVCTVAGTTANTTDAAWSLYNRGVSLVDGTARWQECTGISAVNGDFINTLSWSQAKAFGTNPSSGVIIKRNNGASYHINTNGAGAMGASEPAFSDVPGATIADGGTNWTCIGLVGSFNGGAAPHARLANALNAGWFIAPGNTVYVGDNHAETQATTNTMTVLSAATGVINNILCHDHAGSYPPNSPTTGATITTTGNNSMQLTAASTYVYGITFKAGIGGSAGGLNILTGTMANQPWIYLDNCSLQALGTGSAPIAIGASTTSTQGVVTLNNTTVGFGNVSLFVVLTALVFRWQNTGPVLAAGSSIPNVLFNQSNSTQMLNEVVLEALDLSQIPGTLFMNNAYTTGVVFIKDCKLSPTSTSNIMIPSPLVSGMVIQLARCDSGTAAYKSTRYTYEGTETTETTLVRTNGAADPTGQAQSRKIIATNAQWVRPFKAEPYAMWNDKVGTNVTVTVCGVWCGGALPNTDDVWLEVEYLSDTASPLGKIVTTTKASVLAFGIPVSADSSTWGAAHTTFDAPLVFGGNTVSAALSNGNLTISQQTNQTSMTNSTWFAYAGKYFFEMTNVFKNIGTGDVAGIILPGQPISNILSGINCVAVAPASNTFIYANSISTGINLGTGVSGDVYGFAFDMTNRLAWIRRNGGNWNGSGTANPTTGVGGVSFAAGNFAPAVAISAPSGGEIWTANFGQSTYAFAAPSGFPTWDTALYRFKLVATVTPQLRGYIHVRPRVAKATAVYIDPKITLV